MSAEDNLSQTLFHGTSASLKKGDIIEPRGDVAWAATDAGTAKLYAKRELTGLPHHLIYTKEGTKELGAYQMPMFNPVYTVEPVDKQESEETSVNKGVASNVRVSNKGFRVTGVHSYESRPLEWK